MPGDSSPWSPQSVVHSPPLEATFDKPLEASALIKNHEKRNFKLGVLFLVLAVFTWIVGLELVSSVLKGNEYSKPFFLAVLTGSCFVVNFIPDVLYFVYSFLHETKREPVDDDAVPLTNSEVYWLAAQIAAIYLCYNTLSMSGLQYTSAANLTVLGSTTAMFTFFITVVSGTDRFSLKKLACVLSSLCGVVLVNVGDKGRSVALKNPVLGNTLVLMAAFCYSLYLLVMKAKCGTGNRTTNERILFGYVGVFTIVMGVPLICVLHVLSIEKFALPPSGKVIAMTLTNAVFSVLSDFFTILAMLVTSPLVTSLSLTSSIPLTILVDLLLLKMRGMAVNISGMYMYFFGVFCILMSVVLININVTAENDLIEKAIEDAFEDALRDEMLSPILTPLLEPRTDSEIAPLLLPSLGLEARKGKMVLFGGMNHTYKVRLPEG